MGFISTYLFIYSFIYLCFPPLSHLALVCWVGQSGVLEPWGVTVGAAPGPLGHLVSICDVGVDLILSYFLNLFAIFIQAGSVRLLKAGLHCLYK